MSYRILLILISYLLMYLTNAQRFFEPASRNQVAHRAVVEAAAQESQFPAHLLNPFYKNAGLRDALARHSWFGPGEQPVLDRHAERIPRKEIYTVLNHAGLIRTH